MTSPHERPLADMVREERAILRANPTRSNPLTPCERSWLRREILNHAINSHRHRDPVAAPRP